MGITKMLGVRRLPRNHAVFALLVAVLFAGCSTDSPSTTQASATTNTAGTTSTGEPLRSFNEEARDLFGVDGGVFLDADGRVEGDGRVTAETAAREGVCLSATLERDGRTLDLIFAPGFDEIDVEGFSDLAMETFCPWKFDEDDPRWRSDVEG